jgi:predicted ATPase
VVFRRLSVFRGGFDLAAAVEVAGTQPVVPGRVGTLVEQLVSASLLEADTSGTRTRFRGNVPEGGQDHHAEQDCRQRCPAWDASGSAVKRLDSFTASEVLGIY